MHNDLVKRWFTDRFQHLHPQLQQLHTEGGTLSGDVDIQYGSGLAGAIGARLGRKMNLPAAGRHRLRVIISHDQEGLHWDRRFNEQTWVRSLFQPVGTADQGYWVETTGPLTLHLTVDIVNGGWYWRCMNIRFLGLPLPLWLVPQTTAYKIIEGKDYRFHVGFSLPLIGQLVTYEGLLRMDSIDDR